MEERPGSHEAAERGIMATLNEKFRLLGRLGLMAGALSGLVGGLAQEAAAAAPGGFSAVTGKPLSLDERLAHNLISGAVGNRVLPGLERRATHPTTTVERRTVPVTGFEKRENIQKAIDATLASFPRSFLDNIETLRFEDRSIGLGSAYGMKGVEAAHADRATYEVMFSKGSEGYGPFLTASTLEHEACHLNAPDSHRGLEPTDRYAMYKVLLERVQAPDRFHSWYVEQINNPDAQVQLYQKAGEYWAETCAAYLEGNATLPAADRAMVKALISKTDPAYDEAVFEKARYERGKILLKLAPRGKAKSKSKA